MELRLLVRFLSILTTVMVVISIAKDSLLYMLAIVVGIVTLIIFRKKKPEEVQPYFWLTLSATVIASLVFAVQAIIGFIYFLQTTS